MLFIRVFSILCLSIAAVLGAQPSAPASVSAGVTACSQVAVSWSAVSANPSVTGYKIYRNGTCIFTNGTTLTYADSNLLPTGYAYQISTLNKNGESPLSTSVGSVSPCSDVTAPQTPSGLAASATNYSQVNLSWHAASDIPGNSYETVSGVVGYRVYRDGAFIIQTAGTSATDSGLNDSSTYGYTVSALDGTGNESVVSSSVSATTLPAAPATNVKLALDQGTAMLTWNGTPGVLYQPLSAPNFLGPWTAVDVPTTNFSSASLAIAPTASFKVIPFSQTAAYKGSAPTSSKDKAPPTIPSNLTAAATSCSQVNLSWTASVDQGTKVGGTTYTSGLASYTIYRNNVSLKVVVAPATTYSDTTVAPSTSYTYTVAATDNAGNTSAKSSPANVAVPSCSGPCTSIINLSSSPSGGGTTSGGGTFSCGSVVTVAATPNAGYSFVSWTQNGNVVSGSASYTFTANASVTLVANFSQITYTISTSASPSAGGTTSGGGIYGSGSSVTVTATPNAGYNFVNWTENGNLVSSSANYTFTASANRTLLANFVPSGAPGQLQWVTNSSAVAGNNAIQLALAADHAGNVVGVGKFAGTANFGTGPLSTASSVDYNGVIVKYDSQGHPLWARQIGNALSSIGGDAVTGVAIDSQNNIIVIGYFSLSVDFGGTILTPGGSRPNIFVAKYGTNNTLSWVKKFGGTSDDRGLAVAVGPNDDVYVTAEFTSYTVDFGGTVLTNADTYDGVVLKLWGNTGSWGTAGNTAWATRISGQTLNFPYAIAVDRFGDAVVAGNFAGGNLAKVSGTNGAIQWVKPTGGTGNGVATDPGNGNIIVTGGNGGIFLSAFDPSGQTNLWTITTGSGSDAGTAISVDANGNLAVTGKAFDGIYFGGTQMLLGNGQYNAFLATFTLSGNSAAVYQWGKYFGYNSATAQSGGTGVAIDSLGHVIMGGSMSGTIDFGGASISVPSGYNAAFTAQYSR